MCFVFKFRKRVKSVAVPANLGRRVNMMAVSESVTAGMVLRRINNLYGKLNPQVINEYLWSSGF